MGNAKEQIQRKRGSIDKNGSKPRLKTKKATGIRKKRVTATSKASRIRLTIDEQLDIISMSDQNQSYQQIATETHLPKSTVRNIIKRRKKIEEAKSYADKSIKSIRTLSHPDVDNAVWLWYLSEKNKTSFVISDELLMQQAKTFHQQLCDKDDFCASKGWCRAFKMRKGIVKQKETGDPLTLAESVEPKSNEKELSFETVFIHTNLSSTDELCTKKWTKERQALEAVYFLRDYFSERYDHDNILFLNRMKGEIEGHINGYF